MRITGKIQLLLIGRQQKEIAQAMGCSHSYISRCLAGKQKPSKRLIEVAERVTGLKTEQLFEVKPLKGIPW